MFDQNTLKNIRNKHLSDILKVLRQEEMCSLALLTEKSDGGLTTVKKCVQQAIDYGMIIEGDIANSTGGRKAQQYRINVKYQYFLIMIIDNNNIKYKIFDFNYKCVKEYLAQFQMKEWEASLMNCIDNALCEYNIGTVCLSLPCVVKNGTIIDWYYNQSACGINIKSRIEEKYFVNTIIQNDMKMTVIGESSKTNKNDGNIVTAQFGHNGIGVGEMVSGNIVDGYSGFAGEVAYMNDIRKDIMSYKYIAKIIRNVIICINPEIIVFYKSERQNQFNKIFSEATKGLPSYAIPRLKVVDGYFESIISGFLMLINKNGYFIKTENRL